MDCFILGYVGISGRSQGGSLVNIVLWFAIRGVCAVCVGVKIVLVGAESDRELTGRIRFGNTSDAGPTRA